MTNQLAAALAFLVAPFAAAAGLVDDARNRCAAQLGVTAAELEDVVENTTTLPATKVTFSAFKFIRPDVPGFCQISLLPDGTEVSGDELMQAELGADPIFTQPFAARPHGASRAWVRVGA